MTLLARSIHTHLTLCDALAREIDTPDDCMQLNSSSKVGTPTTCARENVRKGTRATQRAAPVLAESQPSTGARKDAARVERLHHKYDGAIKPQAAPETPSPAAIVKPSKIHLCSTLQALGCGQAKARVCGYCRSTAYLCCTTCCRDPRSDRVYGIRHMQSEHRS